MTGKDILELLGYLIAIASGIAFIVLVVMALQHEGVEKTHYLLYAIIAYLISANNE